MRSETFDLIYKFVSLIVLPALALWVRFYMRAGAAQKALLAASELARDVVEELNSEKRNLIDPEKPGAWNPQAGAHLKTVARRRIVKGLGKSADLLREWLGGEMNFSDMLDSVIEGKVEATRRPTFTTLTAGRLEVTDEVHDAPARNGGGA
jgi:hypothetical protein